MSHGNQAGAVAKPTDAQLEQATSWFMRVRSEAARAEDLPELRNWIESDPLNKLAYQQVAATWGMVGQFGSAPKVMMGRRDALDHARRAGRRRWSMRRGMPRYTAFAASAVLAVAAASAWFHFQRNVYTTDLGERRALTLQDGSVVTLDAKSRVRVQYEEDGRTLWLEGGQARFDVAKDPGRPFRVRAGNQTVIALGTQFNVELVAGKVLVSILEGHVAVTGIDSSTASSVQDKSGAETSAARQAGSAAAAVTRPEVAALEAQGSGAVAYLSAVELKAGEGLRVEADGRAVVLPEIDVERATAWQSGRTFFDNEPLASAAERINRYSQQQIIVDPSVADVGVSGVFNAGDSNAFAEAISAYFPVQVERVNSLKIHLTRRD